MGRLGGFRHRDVTKRLKRFGMEFERQGADSHEIWRRTITGVRTIIPNHAGAISEGTLRSILRQAGISADDFLAD